MSPPPAFRHLLSGNSLKGPLYRVPLMNIPHDFPCDSLAVLPLRGFQGEAWWYGYTPVHPVENVFVTGHQNQAEETPTLSCGEESAPLLSCITV